MAMDILYHIYSYTEDGRVNMSQSTGERADPFFQLAFASMAPLFMDGAKIKMFHNSKEYMFPG